MGIGDVNAIKLQLEFAFAVELDRAVGSGTGDDVTHALCRAGDGDMSAIDRDHDRIGIAGYRGRIAIEGMELHGVFNTAIILDYAGEIRIFIHTDILPPDGAVLAIVQQARHRSILEQLHGHRRTATFIVMYIFRIIGVLYGHPTIVPANQIILNFT